MSGPVIDLGHAGCYLVEGESGWAGGTGGGFRLLVGVLFGGGFYRMSTAATVSIKVVASSS